MNKYIKNIYNTEFNILQKIILTPQFTTIIVITLIILAILAVSQQNPIKGILPIILITINTWPLITIVTNDIDTSTIIKATQIWDKHKQYQSWNI